MRSVPEIGSLRPIGSNWTPSERGKNSYQDPKRARSRSTSTGIRPDLVTRSRSGYASRIALTRGVRAAASRSQGGRLRSRSLRASALSSVRAAAGRAAPGGCLIARAARSKSSAPSASMSSTSWPRGILMPASWSQCAIGSDHDSTWKYQVPSLGDGHVRPVPVRAGRELPHPDQRAVLARRISQHHGGAEHAVPFPDDGRADLEGLAGDRLSGAAPALHYGLDIEDGDASDHAVTVPSRDP